jgi:hypothetical protein
MIISSFLIGGCYTQLERSAVQIEDENEYYDETAESESDAAEYETETDTDRDAASDVEYNYYFYDSPYQSNYPYYYRPFSRFDALLYFDHYDFWLNYYTWWPVAGYWPGYSFYHNDPWGYRYRHFGPHWRDHYYYASGHHYSDSRGPREQRPFLGQGPAVRTMPRGEKQRTDIKPVSQKRFVRTDQPTVVPNSSKRTTKNYTGQKTRSDRTTGTISRGAVQASKERRREETPQQVTKSKNTTPEKSRAPSSARSSNKSASKQPQPAARPSRSSSSTPKQSTVQPSGNSSKGSSNSGSNSKSSNSSSKSTSGSSKKKN